MGLNKNQNSGNFNGEVGDMSNYATKSDLATKVTKETNKSLVDNTLIDKLEDLENYDDSLVREEINSINSQLAQNMNELNDKIDEVATKGTTVETITNVVENVMNEKITSGEIANMIIEDGSITEEKLHANFLDKIMGTEDESIVTEMEYSERTNTFSANVYFGINKKINGKKITKLSIHGKANGVVNIAVFELISDTQINVTSINSYDVVVGRNDFDVDIPLNESTDNYIAIEGAISYSLDTSGYTFSQITKANMKLGSVTSKFGTSNPMFVGVGIEVSRGGNRVPLTDILEADIDKNANDILDFKSELSLIKEELKNNSGAHKIKFNVLRSEDFKTNNSEWVYDNCTPSDNGLELNGSSEAYMNKYNLYFDDSKQRITFKLNDTTSILGIGLKSNATTFTSYIADFNEKKLKMYSTGTISDLSSTTKIAATKEIDIPIISGDMYTLLMTRESGIHTLELKNIKTGKIVTLSFRTDTTKVNGAYYTLRSGSPSLIQLQGTTTILKYDYLIGNFNECECLFLGDSITEGLQIAKEDRWCELLNKNYFEGKSIISGISGTNSSLLLMRLNELISLGLKPKSVIVSIGTNDILSEAGLNSWKINIVNIYNKIVDLGAVPIIAVPPIYNSQFYLQLGQFILEKGWNTLRFDIATSLNGDGTTQNSSLFADGIHPNEKGGLAMYNQAIKDLEYIF